MNAKLLNELEKQYRQIQVQKGQTSDLENRLSCIEPPDQSKVRAWIWIAR
jgi:hypothetical protein